MAGTILQQAVGRAAARPLTACSTAQWRPAAALSSIAAPQQRLGQAAAQQRAQRRHLSAAAAALRRSARGLAMRPRAAMFDGLSRSLEKAWDTVRKDGKLSADNIKEPMREIRCVCHCLLASMNKPLWQCCAAVASTSMAASWAGSQPLVSSRPCTNALDSTATRTSQNQKLYAPHAGVRCWKLMCRCLWCGAL